MSISPARAFLQGVRDALPLQLATFPFGLIFGALARETGLAVDQVMVMTASVIAGASQLTAVRLMGEGAPVAIAVAAGAVVNLRMMMYSASLAPHWAEAPRWLRACAALLLHDQTYALSIARYGNHPQDGVRARIGYYFGVGALCLFFWLSGSLTGALAGARVPPEWGLSFAIPAVFIALVAPMLRHPAHIAAAATAGALALLLRGLPLSLGLALAALAGIAMGATTDWLLTRRGAR